MTRDDLLTLQQQLTGKVILPDDPAYETARNSLFHKGSPAGVVQPATNNDVAAAIKFARDNHLKLSVRSGGHALNGLSTNDDGLVIDMSNMNGIEILDAKAGLVRIGAGARWGDVGFKLSKYNLAISSGDTISVGVGGLTVGGGVGWLVRKYGLALDNVVAAEIVLADGETLRASADEHEDLFWAIRGGGGNFGVVTSFEFRAHELKGIVGGTVLYPLNEAKQVVHGWAAYMRTAPEELNSTLVLFPGIDGQAPPMLMVIVCYGGDDEAKANEIIKPLLELGTIQNKDISKKPYYQMLQEAVLPPGLKNAAIAGFIKTLSDDVLDAFASNFGKPDTPIIQIRALGGAINRVSPSVTAFAHRDAEVLVWAVSLVPTDTPPDRAKQTIDEGSKSIAPFMHGAYVNFQSFVDDATVREAYPPLTYGRLTKIKAVYDPENVFNQNANIKPAA